MNYKHAGLLLAISMTLAGCVGPVLESSGPGYGEPVYGGPVYNRYPAPDYGQWSWDDSLNVYVSAGYPTIYYYSDRSYWRIEDYRWVRSYDYRGPWRVVETRYVPVPLKSRHHDLDHRRERWEREHHDHGRYERHDRDRRDRHDHDRYKRDRYEHDKRQRDRFERDERERRERHEHDRREWERQQHDRSHYERERRDQRRDDYRGYHGGLQERDLRPERTGDRGEHRDDHQSNQGYQQIIDQRMSQDRVSRQERERLERERERTQKRDENIERKRQVLEDALERARSR